MIDKLSIDLSDHRLTKAKDLLSQAKLLHNSMKYDGSINRSYYSIFNTIRLMLALVKSDSTRHSGIISLFDKIYVKTKIFDKKYSIIAHSAFDHRQENDYEDFYIPTRDESDNQIIGCEDFISEAEKIKQMLIEGKIKLPKTEK